MWRHTSNRETLVPDARRRAWPCCGGGAGLEEEQAVVGALHRSACSSALRARATRGHASSCGAHAPQEPAHIRLLARHGVAVSVQGALAPTAGSNWLSVSALSGEKLPLDRIVARPARFARLAAASDDGARPSRSGSAINSWSAAAEARPESSGATLGVARGDHPGPRAMFVGFNRLSTVGRSWGRLDEPCGPFDPGPLAIVGAAPRPSRQGPGTRTPGRKRVASVYVRHHLRLPNPKGKRPPGSTPAMYCDGQACRLLSPVPARIKGPPGLAKPIPPVYVGGTTPISSPMRLGHD